MQFSDLSDYTDVFLNKVTLLAIPAAGSGVVVTKLTSYDLFSIGGFTVTSVHAGMAFTVFVGAVTVLHILIALYDKILSTRDHLRSIRDHDLSIKLKEKELGND